MVVTKNAQVYLTEPVFLKLCERQRDWVSSQV